MENKKTFKEKTIDAYIKRPILYDIIISLVISCGLKILNFFEFVDFDFSDDSFKSHIIDISSEIGIAVITLAGFILTVLTIIVTFKNTINTDILKEKNLTTIFYTSDFYLKSVLLLKNSVKILLLIFFSAFFSKLFNRFSIELVFYFNLFVLTISLLNAYRFLLVLGIIISFQTDKRED